MESIKYLKKNGACAVFSFSHNLFVAKIPGILTIFWKNNYQYLLSQELGEINRQHKGLFVFMQIFGINKITLKNTA